MNSRQRSNVAARHHLKSITSPLHVRLILRGFVPQTSSLSHSSSGSSNAIDCCFENPQRRSLMAHGGSPYRTTTFYRGSHHEVSTQDASRRHHRETGVSPTARG